LCAEAYARLFASASRVSRRVSPRGPSSLSVTSATWPAPRTSIVPFVARSPRSTGHAPPPGAPSSSVARKTTDMCVSTTASGAQPAISAPSMHRLTYAFDHGAGD